MRTSVMNRQFTHGYIKGWVDASSGINLPEALTDAIKELSRLANREDAGLLPDRPLIVSRAKPANRKPIGKDGDAAHVWQIIKGILRNGPMMPKNVVIALQENRDKIVQRYITNKSGRVGQMLVYNSKTTNPQVIRVADGYELTTFGTIGIEKEA